LKGVSISAIPKDIKEHAEAILLPAWVVDAATSEIRYCNRRSRSIFTQVVSGKLITEYLNGNSSKSLITALSNKGFYSQVDELKVEDDSKKFQITANGLKESLALITLLEINNGDNSVSKGRDYGYDDLFEKATDLIIGTSAKGKIIYVNNSWVSKLGYSEENSVKKNIYDIVLPEDRDLYSDHRDKVLKGEDTTPILIRLKTRKKNVLIVETNDHLKLVNGKAHSIRSIMRDVTSTVDARTQVRKQAAKMEAMLNSGELMFWTVNRKISLTSFNQQYSDVIYQLYGKRPKTNPDITKPKLKFASDSYHNFWKKKYDQVFKTGKGIVFQTKTKDRKGVYYFREIYLNPIFDQETPGHVAEVAGLGIDITDKKLAQQKLNEEALKSQTIFNSANQMVWSVDKDWNFTSINDIFRRRSIKHFDREPKLGENFFQYLKETAPELIHQWKAAKKQLNEKTSCHFEVAVEDIHGSKEIEDITVSPILDDEKKLKEIACISQTITYKRAAERKLKEQAAKINTIFNSSAMIIWSVDEKMHLVSFNEKFSREFFRWFGKEASIGVNMLEILRGHVKKEAFSNYKKIIKRVFKGNPEQFEGIIVNNEGQKIWLESFYRPMYSQGNKVTEMSCMAHDITDKKTIEYQMRESIREKEILLQEVHHRVKNNLQVISSILNLQSSYVKDEKSLSILRESQNRIKSMSFIHESLYQTRDFSKIEFTSYILSLVKNLIHTYHIRNSEIELKTDFQKSSLELDQAIPCGLIVNELVSNSLKYAFQGMKRGEIFIGFKESEGNVELRLGDNGVGFPPDIDFENTETLGLQLVNTLADQLDARIHIDNEGGTEYFITFAKR
jgi:PAS domain S-box-containing protein